MPPRRLLAAGSEFLSKGRFAEARAAFRAALQAAPRDPDAHYLLGHTEFLAGQLLEAERLVGLATVYDGAGRADIRLLFGNILQRQGRLAQAEEKYREALRLEPRSFGACLNLGNVLGEQGRLEEALAAYDEALRLNGAFLPALLNRASALIRAGRLQEARLAYEDASARHPGSFEARFGLASALLGQGEHAGALERFEQCVKLDPVHRESLRHAAMLQGKLGRLERAEALWRRLLGLDPADRDARLRLGRLLADGGRVAEALKELLLLRRREAGWHEAHLALAEAYAAAGRFENAQAANERALELAPENFAARVNRAVLQGNLGRHEAALAELERLSAQAPGNPQVLNAIGVQLRQLGRLEESISRHREALALDAHNPQSHRYLSFSLLAAGDFAEGWAHHARRWKEHGRARVSGAAERRIWRGEPLRGRRIRVGAEQALGDQIMYAGMFPDLLAAGAHCSFECHPRLERLFRRSFPGAAVAARRRGEPAPASADFEILMSELGEFLRRALADFPAHGGYLAADGARRALWRARLEALGPGLKVGIAWRGGTALTDRAARSTNLADWRPVLGIAGARFVSLQYGDCQAEIEAVRAGGCQLAHWPESSLDMDEGAALVSALDLVVSVPNTAIHLAGALGRPVWVLVPARPEWRYGREGERMPWYPSARLLRQERPGDWEPLIRAAAGRLAALAASRG